MKKVRQHAAGIELLKWEYAERESPSDIVIETFGCRIPDPFEKELPKEILLQSGSIWNICQRKTGLRAVTLSLRLIRGMARKNTFFPGSYQ